MRYWVITVTTCYTFNIKPTVLFLAGRNVDQTNAIIAITWNLCLDECLKVREFISPTHIAVFMKEQKYK
jgi:hypothetical protein